VREGQGRRRAREQRSKNGEREGNERAKKGQREGQERRNRGVGEGQKCARVQMKENGREDKARNID
jgi:hypothetical protein